MFLTTALFLALSFSVPFVVASPSNHQTWQNVSSNPIVELDYGSFLGASSSQYNLTYYRKIPFAASTSGQNRFRAPQPPLPITNGTYDTNQAFDMCPQRTVNGSEDCLYLGVYSRPWTKTQQHLRPVLLTFYGGGFIRGSASFSIPPAGYPVLNVSSTNDYVVVYSNYRTNVFGFLPGSKIATHPDVDLNPGLLDQQAALQWIQRYIHHFGGDKRNVTIWGQSAGGGSVVAQAIATGNRGKGLFRKALASSPFWPKTWRYDSAWAEKLYQATLRDVGCSNATDEIACLKEVDVQKLRESALKMSTSQQYTTASFTYGPVIDTEFLTESLSSVVAAKGRGSGGGGGLNAEMVLASYNLHEGENFIPPEFSSQKNGSDDGFNASTASFSTWLKGFLPDLTPNDLDMVKKIYPEAGVAEEISWNTTFVRAGMVYRDLVLACPAYWLAVAGKAGERGKGWLVEYTIDPAKHASDVVYVCSPPMSSSTSLYYTRPQTTYILLT
ncbi:carboxylesterase [Pyrenophora seminiperda CCB06]|uniref:Carboxylic ester hydrolase n=1 Tax=Pyrenophora seminiperda CCB06 TaxID=1302712 RepID=A0A3M7MCN1_9PLEO|nr:carboxylesterase [Pyrenophora seminiperda CCB06]